MPIAFNLRCDDETGLVVRRLWAEAELLENSASMSRMGYPPHVTLVQSDSLAETAAIEALGRIDLPASSLNLVVEAVGLFEGPEHIILWCSIVETNVLRELHSHVCRTLGEHRVRQNYRQDRWRPHCTIATRVPIERRTEAVSFAKRRRAPFVVHFSIIDVVTHPPVRIVAERPIRGTA